MAWNDIGFSETLVREDTVATQQELDPLQFESFAPELSASKLTGLMQSQDGKVLLNLDENFIVISDGTEERIRLGKLKDGTFGIELKDQQGNSLMRIGDVNVIKSADNTMELDFDETRILIRDIGGTPRVLLGKGDF